ncbi:hypothetical protein [Actinomadura rudentiformis]|uniref:Transmembrane protein n=1 Tax=Actinomadura rudentiformis TaxID=359158 RepID=A0A6H9YSX2_9ACTN|nr:hypothetical protein [Actinomadura rudentiformis]KAB2343418.1 hypothetical protein F8566_35410 [Actinomadura rudentiformis]
MAVLTVLLLPALFFGALGLLLVGAPSHPCPPEDAACADKPGLFEFAGFGLAGSGVALVAIFSAWRRRGLSPRRRIVILATGNALFLLWLAIWFDRLF